VAHIYNASEKDAVEDPLEEKKKALDHYKQAREVRGRNPKCPLLVVCVSRGLPQRYAHRAMFTGDHAVD
jgi:hypothetical protein